MSTMTVDGILSTLRRNVAIASLAGMAAFAPGVGLAQDKPVAGEVKEGSLAGKTLTFVSYGGIYQDGQIAAIEEFVKKSGVKLLSDGPTEIAKLQAQVETGNVTWDVVDTADFPPYVHCGTLFQKLDFSKIDVSHVPAGQVGECSVPAMNYGVVLMYNTEKYKDNPPKDWADFFDVEKFPGVRAIDGSGDPVGALIEQALITEGVDPKTMTVADIEKGIAKIKALGPDTIFWKTGAESQQLAESGEADMIMMWTGRAMTAAKNGAKYTPAWKDWLVVMDQLTIPVGVKDTDAAYALLNAYLGKRSQEILTEKTSYSPVNTEATPKVAPEVEAYLTSAPDKAKQGYQQNIKFWVANYEAAAEKWNEMLAGN